MTPAMFPSVAAEGRTPVRQWRLPAGPVLAISVSIAALAARFFLVIWKYSTNVFFYDQWEYLTPFFRRQTGFAQLFFLQHGPHREGLGLLADKFLYPLTNWNARVDAFFIGASIFAAMLLALRLKCKLYGALSYSDVAIPLLFLTLSQYEMLVGASNPACSLPLLLIILYCLTLFVRTRLLRYSLILALNFLLIYTGYGLFMGVVTMAFFLLECYWSWRLITAAPFAQPFTAFAVASASLASFFIHYTFSPGVDCFQLPHDHFLRYPRFMALMFSGSVVPRPLHVSLAVTLLGAAILSGMIGILGWHLLHLIKSPHNPTHLIGAVLLSYSLLFSAHAAIGRLCMGLQAAFASRYVTLLIPAFLAFYFYSLSQPWLGHRNFVLALGILLLLPATVRKPWEEIRWYSNGKRDWANCYLSTRNVHVCDQRANFWVHPYPEQIGLQPKLDYLQQHHLNLFHEPDPK